MMISIDILGVHGRQGPVVPPRHEPETPQPQPRSRGTLSKSPSFDQNSVDGDRKTPVDRRKSPEDDRRPTASPSDFRYSRGKSPLDERSSPGPLSGGDSKRGIPEYRTTPVDGDLGATTSYRKSPVAASRELNRTAEPQYSGRKMSTPSDRLERDEKRRTPVSRDRSPTLDDLDGRKPASEVESRRRSRRDSDLLYQTGKQLSKSPTLDDLEMRGVGTRKKSVDSGRKSPHDSRQHTPVPASRKSPKSPRSPHEDEVHSSPRARRRSSIETSPKTRRKGSVLDYLGGSSEVDRGILDVRDDDEDDDLKSKRRRSPAAEADRRPASKSPSSSSTAKRSTSKSPLRPQSSSKNPFDDVTKRSQSFDDETKSRSKEKKSSVPAARHKKSIKHEVNIDI